MIITLKTTLQKWIDPLQRLLLSPGFISYEINVNQLQLIQSASGSCCFKLAKTIIGSGWGASNLNIFSSFFFSSQVIKNWDRKWKMCYRVSKSWIWSSGNRFSDWGVEKNTNLLSEYRRAFLLFYDALSDLCRSFFIFSNFVFPTLDTSTSSSSISPGCWVKYKQ